MTVDPSGQHPIYPPTAILVLTPLTFFRWSTAVLIYSWVCSAAYIVLVWLLSSHVGDSIRSLRRLGFVAFALSLSPIHTGIAELNPSVLVIILCGFALVLARIRDNPASGVLLAFGFCIKPTSAIAAVLVLLLYRRFRSFAAFIGVCALITIGSAIAMHHVPFGWKEDYQDNLRLLFGHNGAADFASDFTTRFDLVNLQVPAYVILRSIYLANVVAVGTTTVLAMVWFCLFHKERDNNGGSYWLAAGTLSLIALLPVYQRNYNAAVILFLGVWIFRNISEIHAKAALIAAAAFLLPGEAVLDRFPIRSRFAENVAWNAVLMSQLTWSILAVIIICLLCRYKNLISAARSRRLSIAPAQ